jgi:hypothetical protein
VKPGWVAGTGRARALLERRLGAAAIAVARAPSVDDAMPSLLASGYGERLHDARGAGDAQRAIFGTLLWHMRVLAGWLPPGGAELMRTLAAPFEIANVEDRLATLAGEPGSEPFVLGALATAWPGLQDALSARELRERLARSVWGDPGGEEPHPIRFAMQAAWTRRLEVDVPEAAAWAAAFLALQGAVAHAGTVGERFPAPATALQRRVARTVANGTDPTALWQAELALWRRVEDDAAALLRDARHARGVVVACVALLALDAWRAATALEGAARGGSDEIAELLAWT